VKRKANSYKKLWKEYIKTGKVAGLTVFSDTEAKNLIESIMAKRRIQR